MGTMQPTEVVEEISNHSQVSKSVVYSVLEATEELIIEAARNGHAVKLPFIGMFIPSISATAKSTLAQVDASTIKKYSMRFYPSVALHNAEKNTSGEEFPLSITGLQPTSEYLTEEQYNDLQLEHLKRDDLLEHLEATGANLNEVGVDVKEQDIIIED
jgi:nucleoid DNA-binding protein